MRAFVGRDGLFQQGVLLARKEAQFVEDLQVFLGLGEIAGHQVGLAQIFVGAAVLRIQGQRLVVVPEGGIEVAELAVRETEVVLGIGVIRGAGHIGL